MPDILFPLLRTTLILTLCGGLCFLALRKIETQLPHLSRLLWVAVLLTGWCWMQPVIQIPYLAGTPAEDGRQQTADGSREPATASPVETGNIAISESPAASNSSEVSESAVVCRLPPLHRLLSAAYFTGMTITILLAAMGYIRILYRLRYTTFTEDGDTVAGSLEWKKLLTEQGIDSRTIPMVLSKDLGPALILTPLGYRLVVPSELWSELSASGRQGILRHELAHFRRRDVWKSFFVRILTLPHWFNPIAHYAANRFDELAEQLCDRQAFSGQQEGTSEFAKVLLLLHENAPTHFVARQSIFGRNLQRRVAALDLFSNLYRSASVF